MKRTRPNPAIAQRYHRDGTIPARLTRGHHAQPDTRRALAQTAQLRSVGGVSPARPGEDLTRGPTYLGRGNFGHAYSVPDNEGGVLLVKLPTDANIHRRPWTYAEQRQNIMHEVGIANELRAKGVTVVPRAVYVEIDGTPAMVREYGEPVTALTGAEYGDLERQLVDVERKHGFFVRDELSLYRRSDGSVFVGDMGLWQRPARRTKWSPSQAMAPGKMSTTLGQLLGDLTDDGFARKSVSIGGTTAPMRSYPEVMRLAMFGFDDAWGLQDAGSVVAHIREREARGIPSPPDMLRVLRAAERAIASAEKTRPNGAHRKTPRRRS